MSRETYPKNTLQGNIHFIPRLAKTTNTVCGIPDTDGGAIFPYNNLACEICANSEEIKRARYDLEFIFDGDLDLYHADWSKNKHNE